MNPYERVFNRLDGKPVDKVPNLSILMSFASKYIKVNYDKYCKDYRYLVEANIKCNEVFGIDLLSTMSDPYREAYDFGACIEFELDKLPKSKVNLINNVEGIRKLNLFNPNESFRSYDRLKAIELYKKESGNHYPVLGWIEGPFAESAILRGINELMIDIYDEPEFVKEILRICCDQAIIFAKAQIQAGADIIGIGDAAASLVSPEIYSEFILPLERKIIDEIHKSGAKTKLHICGNIEHLLDEIAKTNADIVDIDWMVDFGKSVLKLKNTCSANGNFDPVRVLYRGTHVDVENAVAKCLNVSDEKTFISPGCEVPKDTPYENLMAINNALIKYS